MGRGGRCGCGCGYARARALNQQRSYFEEVSPINLDACTGPQSLSGCSFEPTSWKQTQMVCLPPLNCLVIFKTALYL